jgi:hypothetical protein
MTGSLQYDRLVGHVLYEQLATSVINRTVMGSSLTTVMSKIWFLVDSFEWKHEDNFIR